jgi:hypothetical protein
MAEIQAASDQRIAAMRARIDAMQPQESQQTPEA